MSGVLETGLLIVGGRGRMVTGRCFGSEGSLGMPVQLTLSGWKLRVYERYERDTLSRFPRLGTTRTRSVCWTWLGLRDPQSVVGGRTAYPRCFDFLDSSGYGNWNRCISWRPNVVFFHSDNSFAAVASALRRANQQFACTSGRCKNRATFEELFSRIFRENRLD